MANLLAFLSQTAKAQTPGFYRNLGNVVDIYHAATHSLDQLGWQIDSLGHLKLDKQALILFCQKDGVRAVSKFGRKNHDERLFFDRLGQEITSFGPTTCHYDENQILFIDTGHKTLRALLTDQMTSGFCTEDDRQLITSLCRNVLSKSVLMYQAMETLDWREFEWNRNPAENVKIFPGYLLRRNIHRMLHVECTTPFLGSMPKFPNWDRARKRKALKKRLVASGTHFLPAVRRAVERVSQVPPSVRVVHNDLHLENIIVSNSDATVSLIDFEACGAGYMEYDLALLFGLLLASVSCDEALFTDICNLIFDEALPKLGQAGSTIIVLLPLFLELCLINPSIVSEQFINQNLAHKRLRAFLQDVGSKSS